MKAMDYINLAAIIIIPIVAVVIGQFLQNRSEKRKDKMRVFTHLMSYRALGYVDINSVNILNSVPIIFYNDEEVIRSYSAYTKSLNIKPEDAQQKQKEIEDNKTKMLIAMSKALGYKKIDWETIQNPYIPKGLLQAMSEQQSIMQGQIALARMLNGVANQEQLIAMKQLGEKIEENIKPINTETTNA